MQAGADVTPLIFLDRDPVHPPLQITQENVRDLCTFCFLEVRVISLPISFGMSAYIPALVTNRTCDRTEASCLGQSVAGTSEEQQSTLYIQLDEARRAIRLLVHSDLCYICKCNDALQAWPD